jgi:hypothetical protein
MLTALSHLYKCAAIRYYIETSRWEGGGVLLSLPNCTLSLVNFSTPQKQETNNQTVYTINTRASFFGSSVRLTWNDVTSLYCQPRWHFCSSFFLAGISNGDWKTWSSCVVDGLLATTFLRWLPGTIRVCATHSTRVVVPPVSWQLAFLCHLLFCYIFPERAQFGQIVFY